MPVRLHAPTERLLDLPPPYTPVALRERGDAYAHACAIAGEAGAGTLVWVRRFDTAELAVVLEPDEPLATARRAFYAGMNALADALGSHAPPERTVGFRWPDQIRIDGALAGAARCGWPAEAREDAPPDWLVFAAIVRTTALRAPEPGSRPELTTLDEQGFEMLDPAGLIESFSRHLMAALDALQEQGFAGVAARYAAHLEHDPEMRAVIDDKGDLTLRRDGLPPEPRSLAAALAGPSWRASEEVRAWL